VPDSAELRWIVTQLHQLSGYLLSIGPTGSQPNEPANWRIAVRMAREQLEADAKTAEEPAAFMEIEGGTWSGQVPDGTVANNTKHWLATQAPVGQAPTSELRYVPPRVIAHLE